MNLCRALYPSAFPSAAVNQILLSRANRFQIFECEYSDRFAGLDSRVFSRYASYVKSTGHRRAEMITILNLKGGVGKTHAFWLLAGVCEERGLNRVRVLQRAERLGLLSERELQARLTSLAAFAKEADVKSWRFRDSVLQPLAVNDP